MLSRNIGDVQARYDKAFSSGRRTFRHNLRLKLAIYEGMRNRYYEYARRMAEKLEEQEILIEQG